GTDVNGTNGSGSVGPGNGTDVNGTNGSGSVGPGNGTDVNGTNGTEPVNPSNGTDVNGTNGSGSVGPGNGTDVNGTNGTEGNPQDDKNNTGDVNADDGNGTAPLLDTRISIEAKDVNYGEKVTINLLLNDVESKPINGTVKLNLNNDLYDLNVTNGQASISFDNMSSNTYGAYAYFQGNELCNPSSFFASFKVNKLSTFIESNDMNTTSVNAKVDGRIGEYFIIQLKDSNGVPLANKDVKIGFNGVVYNRTTTENGTARLQINLAYEGLYTFAIAFLGDENYNSSFVVSKITVNKQVPKLTSSSKSYKASAKTKTLTATLKSGSKNPISGMLLTFTVNGKSYSAKTNSKGIATVKVSLSSKKTYKFTVKFAGNGIYANVNATGKVVIK
ncbi:MAG: hypothetical protein IKV87_07215, partial [Methanobrevibacter sp.]|nr:hypothetical protein [Methanobrevibacter sp.]